MPILKLRKSNPHKEIEFELKYLKSLSAKQRFRMMLKKTKEIRNLLKAHGYRKTTQVIKRPIDRLRNSGEFKFLRRLSSKSSRGRDR